MGIGRQLRRAHRPRAKHVVARPLHALLQANHVHRQPRLRPPSIWTMMTTRYLPCRRPTLAQVRDRRQSVSELPLGARDALRCPEMPRDALRCAEMRRDALRRVETLEMLSLSVWDAADRVDPNISILFKETRTLPFLHVFSCQRNSGPVCLRLRAE